MTDKTPFVMSEEQEKLFNALPNLAKRVCIHVVGGMSNIDAYYAAKGTAKTRKTAEACVSEILSHPKTKVFLDSMKQRSIAGALTTRQELKGYLIEHGKLEYIFNSIKRLEDIQGEPDMEQIEVTRISKAIDARVRLLGKYMPDEKSVEVKNEEGGEFATSGKTTIVFSPVGAND